MSSLSYATGGTHGLELRKTGHLITNWGEGGIAEENMVSSTSSLVTSSNKVAGAAACSTTNEFSESIFFLKIIS